MNEALHAVVDYARGLFEELPERGVPGAKTMIERLEAEPPGGTRDRGLAWLFLALARLQLKAGRGREAYAAWLSGFSYARTARDPQAFLRARALEEEVRHARVARAVKRPKHRR